jgi:Tol biopolymer transport system component
MRDLLFVSLCTLGIGAATYACISDDASPAPRPGADAGLLLESGMPNRADAETKRCNVASPFAAAEVMAEVPWIADYTIASATLTADERTLYYTANVNANGLPGKTSDIYTATRANVNDPFGNFKRVDKLSTGADELAVSVVGSGNRLYLSRATANGPRMFYADIADTGIGDAVLLNFRTPDAGSAEDTSPAVRADGTLLYFASIGPSTRAYDLVKVSLPFSSSSPILPISELNTEFGEGSPVLSADEKRIYFSSNRTANSQDVWTASRTNTADPFTKIEKELSLSSTEEDYPTWLSQDGCVMYLTRTIANADGAAKSYRIYVAKRP